MCSERSPRSPRDDVPAPHDDVAERLARAHFAACRSRVDDFVQAQFGPRGTLRLHRAALGPDLLRAPLNVLLAPVHVVVSLAALAADRARLRRLAGWLLRRRVLLPTDTGRAVEARVATALLGVPAAGAAPSAHRADASRPSEAPDAALDPTDPADASAAALLTLPGVEAFRPGNPLARAELGRRMARAVADYAGTRGAVAEASVALLTLCVGALLFRTLTPGMLSMAPSIAGALSLDAAVSSFPLGETLGGVWYSAFPPSVPGGLLVATVATLVLVGAVLAAFAGIVADPLQVRLGIHRRRLHRLLDALEAEAVGSLSTGFPAREHYYARLFDVVDAAVGVLRLFRG